MDIKSDFKVRRPFVKIFANGRELDSVLSARIVSQSGNHASWFQVSAAISGSKFDSWYWMTKTNVVIEISARTSTTEEWTSLIEGRIDELSIDALNSIVNLSGRDYTAVLLDSNSQEIFLNKTASEVATLLAVRRGLTPYIVPTTDLVGRLDSSGHSYVSLSQYSRTISDWDILVDLARREGCEVFVSGSALYFQPMGSQTRRFSLSVSSVSSMNFDRLLQIVDDWGVTVRSWDSQSQRMFEQIASSEVSRDEDADRPRAQKRYFMTQPNLSQLEVESFAQRHLEELLRCQTTVQIEMPGELVLRPRDELEFPDLAIDNNSTFQLELVDRRFQPSKGFRQRLRLRTIAY